MCIDELDTLFDQRLSVQQNLKLYRAQIVRAYDKLTSECTFKEVDLVLVLRWPMIANKIVKGKFNSNWDGPYVIKIAYEGGAYQLADHNKESRFLVPALA